jgi:Amt family ammonium transporter
MDVVALIFNPDLLQYSQTNATDTMFVLISAALVLFMTPGLAMFYGGMVRSKNILSTTMHSFILISLIGLEWVLIGYSMAFGPDVAGITGDLSLIGLNGVGWWPSLDYATTIPQGAFMIFQCMFAVITVALISGAFAERIRFSAFLVFSLLWAVLIYNPLCHWVWGAGGFLGKLGVADFAGGLVVHLSSGISALAVVLIIGPRRGFGTEAFMPNNLSLTLAGAGVLWFGWFGFNAGSAVALNEIAVSAFIATFVAATCGTLVWTGVEWLHRGNATTLGAASGAVAGLASITPASGFVGPMAAVVIGALGGLLCYGAVLLKARFNYDDSLDVVGIHGMSGVWGSLAVGLFASQAVNPGGPAGLLTSGSISSLLSQLLGVGVTGVFCFVGTLIIAGAVNAVMGLRADDEHEVSGLDLSQHSEAGYTI